MVSTSFILPPSPSPNLRTFLACCNVHNELNYAKILDLLDDNFQYQTLPKSLGKPVLNKEQFYEYLIGVSPLFKGFRVILHEVVESGDIITAHASSEGESVNGTPYTNEYMLIAHFVPAENGRGEVSRISSIKQFVDSGYTLKFFAEEGAEGGGHTLKFLVTEEREKVAAAAEAPATL